MGRFIRPLGLLAIAVVALATPLWAIATLGFFALAAVAWVPGLGPAVLGRIGWARLPGVGRTSGLLASGVLLGFTLMTVLVGNAISPPTTPTVRTSSGASSTGPAGVSDAVSFGNWEYSVSAVSMVSEPSLLSRPKGAWLAVDLRVKNIGKQNFGIGTSDFALLDASNARYSADTLQSITYAISRRVSQLSSLDQFPPGVEVATVIVFDVNPNAGPYRLVLKQARDATISLGAPTAIAASTAPARTSSPPTASPRPTSTSTSTATPRPSATPSPTRTASPVPSAATTPVSAPTAAAAVTPAPAATVAASGASLVITRVFYDGVVPRTEADEYVEVKNVGGAGQNMSGWRVVSARAGQAYSFPAMTIAAGQTCRVYTNEIHPEWCGLSWGRGSAVWNNSGDRASLVDPQGTVVSSMGYLGW